MLIFKPGHLTDEQLLESARFANDYCNVARDDEAGMVADARDAAETGYTSAGEIWEHVVRAYLGGMVRFGARDVEVSQ